MKKEHVDYIKKAMKVLEDSECTDMARIKILRTISDICQMNVKRIEDEHYAQFDEVMTNGAEQK